MAFRSKIGHCDTVDFLPRKRFLGCHSERGSHFFASEAEGDFFFSTRFQAHRSALISPRVLFGWRLAHLVGMTNKRTREN